eukprot:TRINITY_DN2152_c1_g1_i4.p1 TRINITY_DN2152_c1_g1~~TRINITY_DN2152_c1_g1_i4.p1  ORF type:complete len:214 (+),score=26.19 TRINITY_DN2152_c1_g1_i4:43-642(+)
MFPSIYFGLTPRYENEIKAGKELFNSGQTKELHGHTQSVHCVAWNPPGDKLASGSVDKSIRIWSSVDRKNSKDSLELTGHTATVSVMSWNPTSADQLATTSLDSSIRIWDVRSGQSVAKFSTGGEGINITWSPCGNVIACGSKLNQLLHIDTRKMRLVKIIKFHYVINEMSWNKEGTYFYLTTGAGWWWWWWRRRRRWL